MTERDQQGESSEGGGGGSQEGSGGDGDGEPMSQDLSKNWFSAENTLQVYGEVRLEEVYYVYLNYKRGEWGILARFFASCRVLLFCFGADGVSPS